MRLRKWLFSSSALPTAAPVRRNASVLYLTLNTLFVRADRQRRNENASARRSQNASGVNARRFPTEAFGVSVGWRHFPRGLLALSVRCVEESIHDFECFRPDIGRNRQPRLELHVPQRRKRLRQRWAECGQSRHAQRGCRIQTGEAEGVERQRAIQGEAACPERWQPRPMRLGLPVDTSGHEGGVRVQAGYDLGGNSAKNGLLRLP